MKLLALSDEEFEILAQGLTEEALAILNKVRDVSEITRYSCDGSGEMSGMYENFDRGQWFFRHDVLGYKTSDLYKASYKYQDAYIVADTMDDAIAKAARALNVQKSAMHKLKVHLHETGVKVDDDGGYVADEAQFRERFA